MGGKEGNCLCVNHQLLLYSLPPHTHCNCLLKFYTSIVKSSTCLSCHKHTDKVQATHYNPVKNRAVKDLASPHMLSFAEVGQGGLLNMLCEPSLLNQSKMENIVLNRFQKPNQLYINKANKRFKSDSAWQLFSLC